MSHRAIGCALALEAVSIGERLVALSLASYAGRDQSAWPAARTAAARAGLSRRRYLVARDQLVQRGLLEIVPADDGGRSTPVISLSFAAGQSVGRQINAELFEAVLAHSPARCSARVLHAGLAALADEDGVLGGLSTDEICDATGLSERTYRRARQRWAACARSERRRPR